MSFNKILMKQFFNIIFFLFFNYSNGQTVSGRILDSITKQPIDLVNVTLNNSNIGVYTNADGKFKLQIKASTDYLQVSFVGYKSKRIELSNFTNTKQFESKFYLTPNIAQLNEVFVQNKKINYGWAKKINSKRENTQFFGFQFGTENCTYIKNPNRKSGKIKEVILDLKKQSEINKDNPKWKLDYLTDYTIKFYEMDLQNNKPGVVIYNKEIIVDPKNITRVLTINIDSLNIPFPENGICVGVEMINTRYVNPKKVFATIGPIINFTENNEMHPIMGWSRSRYYGEWEFKPAPRSYNRKGKIIYNTMIVDLVIKPEKE